ncbi:MAG TPA: T9SS type A sorting domain-containing protein, partial [Ferruginibacter sp.]|nr:T9SS type A sorting domain-containing protein [Ferruginibacter sp.]
TRQGEKIFSEIVKLPDGSESNQLKVYPVPVTNYIINIEFNHVINENVDVNIYGIRGERLYYNQFPGGNKLLRFKVPPMFINHTIYVLKITFGNEVVSEKIFFE